MSQMAMRPLYTSSPALNDTANRSPVALQAIFSMHWLHISNECSGTCRRWKKKWYLKIKETNRMEKHSKINQLGQVNGTKCCHSTDACYLLQFVAMGGRISDTVVEKKQSKSNKTYQPTKEISGKSTGSKSASSCHHQKKEIDHFKNGFIKEHEPLCLMRIQKCHLRLLIQKPRYETHNNSCPPQCKLATGQSNFHKVPHSFPLHWNEWLLFH